MNSDKGIIAEVRSKSLSLTVTANSLVRRTTVTDKSLYQDLLKLKNTAGVFSSCHVNYQDM